MFLLSVFKRLTVLMRLRKHEEMNEEVTASSATVTVEVLVFVLCLKKV